MPPIEDVLRWRRRGVPPDALLVKWKGASHWHCQWVPRRALEEDSLQSNRLRVRVRCRHSYSLRTARAVACAASLREIRNETLAIAACVLPRLATSGHRTHAPVYACRARLDCARSPLGAPPHSGHTPPPSQMPALPVGLVRVRCLPLSRPPPHTPPSTPSPIHLPPPRRMQRFLSTLRQEAPSTSATSVGESAAPPYHDDDDDDDDDAPYEPSYGEVDRVIACRGRADGLPPEYLVKWRGLPYRAATWESACGPLRGWQQAIDAHRAREAYAERCAREPPPPPAIRSCRSAEQFRGVSESPAFRHGERLRDYQLGGVNWLLLSWHLRRSVILADEMGLGKTAQTVALLELLHTAAGLRGPFLIVAPLSTLAHWEREVARWTTLNAVVLHGERASRELIVRHEFAHGRVMPRDARAAPTEAEAAAAAAVEEAMADAPTRWRRCGRCDGCARPAACGDCAACRKVLDASLSPPTAAPADAAGCAGGGGDGGGSGGRGGVLAGTRTGTGGSGLAPKGPQESSGESDALLRLAAMRAGCVRCMCASRIDALTQRKQESRLRRQAGSASSRAAEADGRTHGPLDAPLIVPSSGASNVRSVGHALADALGAAFAASASPQRGVLGGGGGASSAARTTGGGAPLCATGAIAPLPAVPAQPRVLGLGERPLALPSPLPPKAATARPATQTHRIAELDDSDEDEDGGGAPSGGSAPAFPRATGGASPPAKRPRLEPSAPESTPMAGASTTPAGIAPTGASAGGAFAGGAFADGAFAAAGAMAGGSGLAASASGSAGSDFKFDVLITSYEMLAEELPMLRRIHWRYLVVDEAHRLKNHQSALSQAIRSMPIEHMHLLTGTPVQNNTTELWALLNLLDPAKFPSLGAFVARVGNPPTRSEQLAELQGLLKPYLLGRKKADVEKSLAPLEETVVWVELTAFQKRCYRAILEHKRDVLAPGLRGADAPTLNNLQMELRKCCCHPYLIKGVEATDLAGRSADGPGVGAARLAASGKMVLLSKLLPKLRAEGHRVLLFSQFKRFLDLVSDLLYEEGYSHERLDGNVSAIHRQAAIDRFSRPGSTIFAFLLSTRAGGVGVNLTAADTVIIMDSDWNPQNDVQAMARSHRIGQRKSVKVFRLVTRNTYEAALLDCANRKLGLEQAINRGALAVAEGGEGGEGGEGAAAEGGNATGAAVPPISGKAPDRREVERLLKCGARDIFLPDENDAAFQRFSQADIESLLHSDTTLIRHEQTGGSGSAFSKAAFVADDCVVDMDDPDFWRKMMPAASVLQPESAGGLGKRVVKRAQRMGMVADLSELGGGEIGDDDPDDPDEPDHSAKRPRISAREEDQVRACISRMITMVERAAKTEAVEARRAEQVRRQQAKDEAYEARRAELARKQQARDASEVSRVLEMVVYQVESIARRGALQEAMNRRVAEEAQRERMRRERIAELMRHREAENRAMMEQRRASAPQRPSIQPPPPAIAAAARPSALLQQARAPSTLAASPPASLPPVRPSPPGIQGVQPSPAHSGTAAVTSGPATAKPSTPGGAPGATLVAGPGAVPFAQSRSPSTATHPYRTMAQPMQNPPAQLASSLRWQPPVQLQPSQAQPRVASTSNVLRGTSTASEQRVPLQAPSLPAPVLLPQQQVPPQQQPSLSAARQAPFDPSPFRRKYLVEVVKYSHQIQVADASLSRRASENPVTGTPIPRDYVEFATSSEHKAAHDLLSKLSRKVRDVQIETAQAVALFYDNPAEDEAGVQARVVRFKKWGSLLQSLMALLVVVQTPGDKPSAALYLATKLEHYYHVADCASGGGPDEGRALYEERLKLVAALLDKARSTLHRSVTKTCIEPVLAEFDGEALKAQLVQAIMAEAKASVNRSTAQEGDAVKAAHTAVMHHVARARVRWASLSLLLNAYRSHCFPLDWLMKVSAHVLELKADVIIAAFSRACKLPAPLVATLSQLQQQQQLHQWQQHQAQLQSQHQLLQREQQSTQQLWQRHAQSSEAWLATAQARILQQHQHTERVRQEREQQAERMRQQRERQAVERERLALERQQQAREAAERKAALAEAAAWSHVGERLFTPAMDGIRQGVPTLEALAAVAVARGGTTPSLEQMEALQVRTPRVLNARRGNPAALRIVVLKLQSWRDEYGEELARREANKAAARDARAQGKERAARIEADRRRRLTSGLEAGPVKEAVWAVYTESLERLLLKDEKEQLARQREEARERARQHRGHEEVRSVLERLIMKLVRREEQTKPPEEQVRVVLNEVIGRVVTMHSGNRISADFAQQKMDDLAEYLVRNGGDHGLVSGWAISQKTRLLGNSAGTQDCCLYGG